jgi:hypothetical protein
MADDSRSSADPVPLDIQTRVEVTRLHCVHLRTLLQRLESELTTIEQILATAEYPSVVLVEPFWDGVAEQSEFIALETERLQGYVQCLLPPSPGTGEGMGTQ